MNHRLVAEEVRYILDHFDAGAAFVGGPFVAMANEVRRHVEKVRLWILMGGEPGPGDEPRRAARERERRATGRRPGPGSRRLHDLHGGTTGKPKGAIRAASDPQITLAFMQALG